MGLLNCERSGCGNIMSEYRVAGHDLCRSCHDDLERQARSWPPRTTRIELLAHLAAFLTTPKGWLGHPDEPPEPPEGWVTLDDVTIGPREPV